MPAPVTSHEELARHVGRIAQRAAFRDLRTRMQDIDRQVTQG